MNKCGFAFRIESLLNELEQGNSRLALRYNSDSQFRNALKRMVGNLGDFYGQLDGDGNALQIFEGKLRQWLKHPPDSYIGFWGELNIAHWLIHHQVTHCFIQEANKFRVPDIELTVAGMKVYFEIKTLQENPYDRFAQRLLATFQSSLSIHGVSIEKLVTKDEKAEEILVSIALQMIQDNWLRSPYSPVEYKGTEGEFSVLLPIGSKMIWSWPDSRKIADGTPWLESKLKEVLRDNIEQFKNDEVSFLIWVNLDSSLPSIRTHVSHVIEKFGNKEFSDVAGVIIFDPFLEWELVENTAYRKYSEIKHIGLLDDIAQFPQQQTRLGA